jgi:hypothetical protein
MFDNDGLLPANYPTLKLSRAGESFSVHNRFSAI